LRLNQSLHREKASKSGHNIGKTASGFNRVGFAIEIPVGLRRFGHLPMLGFSEHNVFEQEQRNRCSRYFPESGAEDDISWKILL
jgi:hypothetical protein